MKNIDGVSNFRLRIQYYSDDWLFIRKYQFSIDNKAYEFIPNNVETDVMKISIPIMTLN